MNKIKKTDQEWKNLDQNVKDDYLLQVQGFEQYMKIKGPRLKAVNPDLTKDDVKYVAESLMGLIT